MQGIRHLDEREALNMMVGQLGFDVLATAATHTAGAGSYTDTEEWGAIKCVKTKAVFAAGCTSVVGDDIVATHELEVGDVLYGRFSAIALTSGIVYAYRSVSS